MLAEELLEAVGSDHTLQVFPLRIFNLLGFGREFQPDFSKASYGSIQCSLWESIKHNKSIKIFGNRFNTKDGTAIRDYIHPETVSDYILACVTSSSFANEPINVGSGVGYSVNDLIIAAESLLGINIEKEIFDPRPSDIKAITADRSRLKINLKLLEDEQDLVHLLDFLTR